MHPHLLRSLFLIGCISCLAPMAWADGPGQEDLDEATLKKLTAKNMADLESAIELCESALEKGLDDENKTYAHGLLTATLYEHATRLGQLIFDKRPIDPRWPTARQLAMKDLNRAIEIDPKMGSAQLLIARLQALPGGDRKKAEQAANQAIELLAAEPEQLSKAFVVRGGLAKKPESRLADFEQAIELDPRNLAAWRGRGIHYLTQEKYEKALEDFQTLLQNDPQDFAAHQAIAQTFKQMKQFDKALEHLDKVIESQPSSSLPYALKAQILEENGKIVEAIESLNQAIRVAPKDIAALMTRARMRTSQSQYDLAEGDVDRVLQLQPNMPQAILLRSIIGAAQGKFDEAIGDLQSLLRQNPNNVDLKLQIASYYDAAGEPDRAIKLYNEVLSSDPQRQIALRRRGDSYLSMGQQKEAIDDYEAALLQQPKDSGLLNNLAWIFATSTIDELRNGQRALELAEQACEVTKYQQAHVLSTLAAAYAELGNFEEALKWSTKAVELDPEEGQLARELENYREKKPWREQQSVGTSSDESDLSDAGLDEETKIEEAGLDDTTNDPQETKPVDEAAAQSEAAPATSDN